MNNKSACVDDSTLVNDSTLVEESSPGSLEYLFIGNTTAKILDFLLTYKEFDYSETDIALNANVSSKTIFRDVPKLERLGVIINTRKVGRAKMYKINLESDIAKALEKFVFETAVKREHVSTIGQIQEFQLKNQTIPELGEQSAEELQLKKHPIEEAEQQFNFGTIRLEVENTKKQLLELLKKLKEIEKQDTEVPLKETLEKLEKRRR